MKRGWRQARGGKACCYWLYYTVLYCTYTGLFDLAEGLGRRLGEGDRLEVGRPVAIGCLKPG